ncbi:MAG: ribosomal protein L7/L12 [Pseudoxanthomonas sp.]
MSREIRLPAAAIAALNQGNRIEAIKLVREANHGVDLRGAMEAVDAHASGRQQVPADGHAAPATSLHGLPSEAVAALSSGHVVEAVRIVRQATGLGLKEAKDLVDAYRENPVRGSDLQLDDKLEALAREHGVEIPAAAVDAFNRGNVLEAIKLVRQQVKRGTPPSHDTERDHAGSPVLSSARKAATVSVESNSNSWLWALLLLAGFAAAWLWLGL